MNSISDEERAQVLRWLDDSHDAFIASIADLSDDQWHWKPAPERWSVGQTAEHVVLAEALLFGAVQRALAAPPNPLWEEQTNGKTEFVVRVMPTRTGRARSPERIEPHHGLRHDAAVERFKNQRIGIVQFTAETERPLMRHTAEHPFPVFGILNAYQWLIYIPLHSLRHVRQIAEVKATPGYPRL